MNEITVDLGQLAALFAVGGSLGAVMAFLFKLWQRFLRLERHDERTHALMVLLVKSSFATLDGLKQQGCNGAVTKAREELRKYVIEE